MYQLRPWAHAHTPVLRTVGHLHYPRHDSPAHHSFPPLGQARAGLDLTPILPARILRSTPQHLSCRTRSWPRYAVEVAGVDLFGPHVHLTTQDEGGEIGGHTRERIVGVDSAPVLERGTIIEVGEGSGGRGTGR